MGPEVLHPAWEEPRAGVAHLLEGLEVAVRRQVLQAGRVRWWCSPRDGTAARATRHIICRGKTRAPWCECLIFGVQIKFLNPLITRKPKLRRQRKIFRQQGKMPRPEQMNINVATWGRLLKKNIPLTNKSDLGPDQRHEQENFTGKSHYVSNLSWSHWIPMHYSGLSEKKQDFIGWTVIRTMQQLGVFNIWHSLPKHWWLIASHFSLYSLQMCPMNVAHESRPRLIVHLSQIFYISKPLHWLGAIHHIT